MAAGLWNNKMEKVTIDAVDGFEAISSSVRWYLQCNFPVFSFMEFQLIEFFFYKLMDEIENHQ